jgi:WD40 repeat protein
MGEVWRARDTRLGRLVAIKVIPAHLSAQPEIRARFEREARSISSLNHPHICVLHDVGRENNTDYLVMELVEGESLAKRLARGPLPIGETLRYGAQIADALDRAHRAGIVHRDLKPANVMITKAGAKLMDFGLARGAGEATRPALISSPGDASISPTLSRPLTAEGTIVGTFQYMSPEQLEGAEADARSDLWGFGCMLYEMATGKRAFEGRSQASLISAIMKEEPRPISELSPLAPPELDRIVRRCLAKDPDERWQSAADLKHELQWLASGVSAGGTTIASPTTPRAASRSRPGTLALLAAGAAGVLLATAFGMLPRMFGGAPHEGDALRFEIAERRNFQIESPAEAALSPDGSRIAFGGHDSSGVVGLFVRSMNSIEVRLVPGVRNVRLPFWSPDGRWVGFFAEGRLQKVSIEGGDPISICPAPDPRGGTWSSSGEIVFAPDAEAPLRVVNASGGEARVITRVDRAGGVRGHRYPCFLPDGHHFLYVGVRSAAPHPWYLGDTRDSSSRVIGSGATAPVWSSAGYVLWNTDERVMAQRFSPAGARLEGAPQFVTGDAFCDNFAYPNVTVAGELLFVQRRQQGAIRLFVRKSDGSEMPAFDGLIPTAFDISISHDRRRFVYESEGRQDLWLQDMEGGVPTRLTTDNTYKAAPIWSPDDRRLYYARLLGGGGYEGRMLDLASGADTVIARPGGAFAMPNCVTPDGRWVVLNCSDSSGNADTWIAPGDGSSLARPWKRTTLQEGGAVISHDGKWLASGGLAASGSVICLDAFPGPGPHYEVSAPNVNYVEWSTADDGLIIVDGSGVVSRLPILWTPQVRFGVMKKLFSQDASMILVGLAQDPRGYLMARRDNATRNVSLEGVLNWTRLLERH